MDAERRGEVDTVAAPGYSPGRYSRRGVAGVFGSSRVGGGSRKVVGDFFIGLSHIAKFYFPLFVEQQNICSRPKQITEEEREGHRKSMKRIDLRASEPARDLDQGDDDRGEAADEN